ncbi:hypothetical protein GUJ93_ZPchr0010g10096 [Zizania palustris]|uniref:P-type ATPase A domain-containing protein n=1 Tax=Zizania palustris TaxID=103762 RepID=A0A8J6BRH1_ZIZPA|nr:hypothetical protein GUJ93_ZPchr0010g10096 [Zizania palustris]
MWLCGYVSDEPGRWERIKACLVVSNACKKLARQASFLTVDQFYQSHLTPLQVRNFLTKSIFIEENNVGNVTVALMACLAAKAKVYHNVHWTDKDADILVLGDIINIKLGDIIPAYIYLLEGSQNCHMIV